LSENNQQAETDAAIPSPAVQNILEVFRQAAEECGAYKTISRNKAFLTRSKPFYQQELLEALQTPNPSINDEMILQGQHNLPRGRLIPQILYIALYRAKLLPPPPQ
jgi:hypothetical protein